jgi:lipopolysaccharide cholinephosphotransferase
MEEKDTPCIYGLYIDIFPIDGAPDDMDLARSMESKFRKTKNRLEAISTHNTFGEYISLLTKPKEWGRFVGKTFGFFFRSFYRKYLLSKMNDICYRYDYSDSKIVAVYCGSYGPKEVFPKSWLDGVVPFVYENMEVNLPIGYDHYLRQYYGDYMQLPPEEKRVSHHLKAYFNLDERIPDKEVIKIVGR